MSLAAVGRVAKIVRLSAQANHLGSIFGHPTTNTAKRSTASSPQSSEFDSSPATSPSTHDSCQQPHHNQTHAAERARRPVDGAAVPRRRR